MNLDFFRWGPVRSALSQIAIIDDHDLVVPLALSLTNPDDRIAHKLITRRIITPMIWEATIELLVSNVPGYGVSAAGYQLINYYFPINNKLLELTSLISQGIPTECFPNDLEKIITHDQVDLLSQFPSLDRLIHYLLSLVVSCRAVKCHRWLNNYLIQQNITIDLGELMYQSCQERLAIAVKLELATTVKCGREVGQTYRRVLAIQEDWVLGTLALDWVRL